MHWPHNFFLFLLILLTFDFLLDHLKIIKFINLYKIQFPTLIAYTVFVASSLISQLIEYLRIYLFILEINLNDANN